MSSLPPEDLLWESRRAGGGPHDDAIPPDERLASYRAGSLSDVEVRRLEWVLCGSAGARARMAELAGAPYAQPPGWLRGKILGRRAAEPAWARHRPVAAAVLLAGAMISAAILVDSHRAPTAVRSLPPRLAFDVRVEGLAPTRSGGGLSRALPQTPVRITVEPRGDGLDGLEFGVYADRAGRLRRLGPTDGLRVEPHRGAALLVATARVLVGSEPGTREFFVAVARDGVLPDVLSLDAGRGAEATVPDTLVYPRSITILASHVPPASTIER